MSKKRKRIFLNAIKVFHGMSGQKIKIGNQTFEAPFQGKVNYAINEKDSIIVVHARMSQVAAGPIDSLTPSYVVNLNAVGIQFNNVRIESFLFSAIVFATFGGSPRNSNVTDKVYFVIDGINYNVGNFNKEISGNAQQVDNCNGYMLNLNAGTFTVSFNVCSNDVGLTGFVLSDSLIVDFTMRLKF